MRVKHIETAVQVLLQSKGFSGLLLLFERPAGTIRWYLWHRKVMTAATTLQVLQIDCDRLRAETQELREAVRRAKARCQELYAYLSNNFDALPDHGHRYRNRLAVSSSRAEGCVDDIGNTRLGKRHRMRWSPQGAHCVAVTRAAVLDGRLKVSKIAA
jgi:FtsZ-binding cell division protein ZapB